jgi:restriction system protein
MEIIALIAVCVLAVMLWTRVFQKRCTHGLPIRSDQPCSECERARAAAEMERRQQEEEARRRAEDEKRRLAELRIKEAENIRQLTYLQAMDPIEFERIVTHAYRILGWDVQETPASGDRGVDAYLRRNGKVSILQCKRLTSGRVGTPVLRDLLGTIVAEAADGGILVTTSSFSEDAMKWCAARPIELVDGHKLLKIIASAYPLGSPVPEDFITRRRHPVVVPSRCPWCGAKTKRRRKGRRGPFYGCTAFPNCRWTMPVPRGAYRAIRQQTPATIHISCEACGAINRIPSARAGERARCGKCKAPLPPDEGSV